MKNINFHRQKVRQQRHKRILKRIKIGNDHIRLRITKTNSHIYIQAIDDLKQMTLASSSSLQLKLQNGNAENTKLVASDLLKKIKKAQIERLVLDRGPYKYHGKIKYIADFLRSEGIKI